ncbi:MAG: glycosyltransferase family 39 protein [Bacteroidia bacterium]
MQLKKYWLVILFCLIKFATPFFQHHDFELHRDEYLYLAKGNHLAWGYIEIPPVNGLIAFIVNIMGNSFFAVKSFPALFGALTMLLIGMIITDFRGSYFAQLIGCLSYLLTAYLRINILFQPNALDILLWTFCFYLLINFIKTKNKNLLFELGIVFGFGLLNKYTMGFLIIATVIALIASPYRKLFLDKTIYIAALIAAIIFLPNALWQLQHHLPFLYHMQLLNDTQLQNQHASEFIKSQFLMNLAGSMVWIAGMYSLFTLWGRQYRMIAFIYISVIAMLLMLHGKNYYALGLYPVLFAFGSVHLERYINTRKKLWLKPVLIIFILIAGVPFVPVLIPVFEPKEMVNFCSHLKGTGVLKWEDGDEHPLPQDFADMLGWKELTEKVNTVYTKLSETEKQHLYIDCDNYGLAGAITYYGKAYNLPEAHSDNASFIFWIPELKDITTVIYVGTDEPDTIVYAHTANIIIADSITNPLAREYRTKIFLLRGVDNFLIEATKNQISEERKRFNQ